MGRVLYLSRGHLVLGRLRNRCHRIHGKRHILKGEVVERLLMPGHPPNRPLMPDRPLPRVSHSMAVEDKWKANHGQGRCS